jgi:hypothetical protein
MKAGDLVISIHDKDLGIDCVGLVIECKNKEARVFWGSESHPIGWWWKFQLEIINEGR